MFYFADVETIFYSALASQRKIHAVLIIYIAFGLTKAFSAWCRFNELAIRFAKHLFSQKSPKLLFQQPLYNISMFNQFFTLPVS